MAPVRSLHDILAGLAGDAGAGRGEVADALRDGGHPDLPDGPMAEAIVSFADTAPAEVAEHLAPFVMGHSAVPPAAPPGAGMDVREGLELVATAPAGAPVDPSPWPDPAPATQPAAEPATQPTLEVGDVQYGAGAADPFALDFGEGAGAAGGAGGVEDGGGGAGPGTAAGFPVGGEQPEPGFPSPDPMDLFPDPAASGLDAQFDTGSAGGIDDEVAD